MPVIQFPRVASGMSTDQLADLVARCLKEVEWLSNGNMDSRNIRNIAGYNVGLTELKHSSGLVGMSGANPADPNAIRFWSGNADPTVASFRVQQDGTMYSTKGYIGGFVIGANTLADTAGTFGMSSAVTAGNDLRYWAGSATPSTAPYRVYEDGTVNASNLNITGGSINANYDITIGRYIYLNGASFTAGIEFIPGSIEIYHDPTAGTLRMVAPNGVYANGIKIA